MHPMDYINHRIDYNKLKGKSIDFYGKHNNMLVKRKETLLCKLKNYIQQFVTHLAYENII